MLSIPHFQTAASFTLQHPVRFIDQAIPQLRTTFLEAMHGASSLNGLRRRMGRRFQGGKRVLRPVADRHPVTREWEFTIANVQNAGRAEGAESRVTCRATTVRGQS